VRLSIDAHLISGNKVFITGTRVANRTTLGYGVDTKTQGVDVVVNRPVNAARPASSTSRWPRTPIRNHCQRRSTPP
jgi:hypothetical protein